MTYKRKALFDTLRTVAFGSITGSYAALGVPLTSEAVVISFINDTNANLYFSTDGTNDQLYLPNSSAMILDVRANNPGDGLFIASSTQFYVKHDGSAATSGLAALQILYAGGIN
ncbi:MAG: hypothetical protein PVF65_06035 [Sphingomonadales bacterium]|jgi:hypothetical protein